ncbi:hypothetical protein [Plantibacter sp. 2H11-2]|uniref:hypothetical protein n=1 Tax=Plantibacter sp. 2H11-2 TaxID=3414431 RepID=UPI003CF904C3
MTHYWFPDTTVFRTFEAGNQLDWLATYLGDHGRWTDVIEDEVRKSIRAHAGLGRVFDERWMPDAESISDTGESLEVERFRTVNLGGDPKIPTQHLGESMTFVVMRQRGEYADSCFITDDRDAYDLFPRQGVPTKHSLTVLQELVIRNECTAEEAYAMYVKAWEAGRGFLESPTSHKYFQ